MRSIRFTAARACALAVCAAAAAALAGCANIGTSPAQSGSECRAVPASGEPQTIEMPETTADQLPDPRTVVGPTTAYTRSADITPVSDDPTADQSLPATVPSADGPQQKVTDTTRILALNQNGGLAAAVIGLGFGCNLVGRDISTGYPSTAHLPLVTRGGHELSAEAILALRPTVVITDTSIGPYDVQLQLRDSGIPVVFIPLVYEHGVGGVQAQIQAVADALGVHELGQRLASRTMREINQVVARVAGMSPREYADRPRAVFLYVRGKSVYYWFGEGSGADSLIQSLSMVDVAAEVGFKGMSPTNAEALIKAAPDIIITMTLGIASTGGIDEVLALPGIAETPAGKNRRVIDMSDYEVMSFGPRTAEVLAALGTAVFDPEGAYQPGAPPAPIGQRLAELQSGGQAQSQ